VLEVHCGTTILLSFNLFMVCDWACEYFDVFVVGLKRYLTRLCVHDDRGSWLSVFSGWKVVL